MDRYLQRRNRLRRILGPSGADALLVTDLANVTYLSGFTGDDSYLLVRRDGDVMVSDPRYTIQLEEQCPGLDLYIRPPGDGMVRGVAAVVLKAKVRRLAGEADSMTIGLWDRLAEKLPRTELVVARGLVEQLRVTKDRHEIAQIRQAVAQAEKAFASLRKTLRLEQTEKEAADALDSWLRACGAAGSAFPSVVAAGARSALPHATVTDQPIGTGSFVLLDWGADSGAYKSDLTRILVTGRISPKLQRIYRVVLKAQLAGIRAIRPGAIARDVDRAARSVIAEAGFGRRFGHGLGHGLGLQVHEAPRLGKSSAVVLKPGMVVTVEPGIYLPGWGGIRIEDDVLVTRDGREVLTSLPKELEECLLG